MQFNIQKIPTKLPSLTKCWLRVMGMLQKANFQLHSWYDYWKKRTSERNIPFKDLRKINVDKSLNHCHPICRWGNLLALCASLSLSILGPCRAFPSELELGPAEARVSRLLQLYRWLRLSYSGDSWRTRWCCTTVLIASLTIDPTLATEFNISPGYSQLYPYPSSSSDADPDSDQIHL